ncbi:hypothetical protein ABL78_8169 [Leptomonas seymouri]|uniref:Uncharacterized protein n=1 Tax=Leptomonas seymouri TaxID=5684 RepID=A0A0N1P9E1_LEPSE|nr:hypothetical protein ABL78_8169 [Leptomonas seymouri]|eukprot:KPI82820.1 hypothetical protein ABL78_8169 [Leptomonas seymouri]
MASMASANACSAGYAAEGPPSHQQSGHASVNVFKPDELPPGASEGRGESGVEGTTSAAAAMATMGGGDVKGTAEVMISTTPKRPSANHPAFTAAAVPAAGAAQQTRASNEYKAAVAAPQDGSAPPWLSSLKAATVESGGDRHASPDAAEGAMVLCEQQQQQQSQPPWQACNTNGVCEDIANAAHHAAGGAGLWGRTANGGAPPFHPPSGNAVAAGNQPCTQPQPSACRQTPLSTAKDAGAGCAVGAAAVRCSSEHYTNPALPQYNSSNEVLLLSEKRMSNPFSSYSTDPFAVDHVGRSGGSAGATEAVTQSGEGLPNTGELTIPSQQPQSPQQLEVYNQRPSVVLQQQAVQCNDELQRLLREAHHVYEQAEARLLGDGLSLIEDWMRTRDVFFSAGSLFAAVGDATASARCFLHATFINRAFHNEDEATTTLSMSVEQLRRAHPRIAVDSLLRLAPCYARRNLRYQTAHCYREAAEILETELGEREMAVELYRTTLEIYADTQVAAQALSRKWESEQRHQQQKQKESRSMMSMGLVDASGNSVLQLTAPAAKGDERSSSPSTSLVRSYDLDITLANMKAGVPPPYYQVSTTVQRSLIDACRERLLVLLAQLHRYEELMDVALTCAANVPRSLPRTKHLLCATLSVLARGAPPPVTAGKEKGETAKTTAKAARPTGSIPAMMSPEAEAAETMYFDSLYDTAKVFSSLQEEERAFQRGKENELVRALLEANRACSLRMFDEAVRTYNNYTTTEPSVVMDVLLGQCRRCLFEHVERFA